MKTKNFEFTFKEKIVHHDTTFILVLKCECIAYLYYDGSLQSIDIETVYMDNQMVPGNLIWAINEDLFSKMECEAYNIADELYYAIDTTDGERNINR